MIGQGVHYTLVSAYLISVEVVKATPNHRTERLFDALTSRLSRGHHRVGELCAAFIIVPPISYKETIMADSEREQDGSTQRYR